MEDKFPKEVKLDLKDDPNDPQSPEIKVTINAFSRPVLRFQVKLRDDQTPTEVFVTHLKSKLPTDVSEAPWFVAKPEMFKPHQNALGAGISTIRRTAEAVALRVILTGVMKGTATPVIVLGDINDGQSSNTANILTEQPNFLVGEATGGADVGSTPHRHCRNTVTLAMSTTPTCTRTSASRSITSLSASSSTTTAGSGCGCSTAW